MSGVLFLIVGNSGCGKDAVINYASNKLYYLNSVKRYITRPESRETEDFNSVSKEDFNSNNYFLSWESYDKLYGIGEEVLNGLKQGEYYIVNISRNAISEAKEKWSNSYVVEFKTDLNIIRNRLLSRARESEEEIKKRLDRAQTAPQINPNIVIDTSNHDVSIAGERLISFIRSVYYGKII